MFNQGIMEINEPAYNHPKVYEIVEKLGPYHFGDKNFTDDFDREKRPLV